MEHEQEQRDVLPVRLRGKIDRLSRQHNLLLSRGLFGQADAIDAKRAKFQYMLDEVNSR